MIEKLNRKQLRYLMFRFKNEATNDGEIIRGPEAKTLLAGWGIDTTKTKANGVLGDLKDHYESQEAFGGWGNFCGPEGVVNSWDIGMYNPESGPMNLALMYSRPHKWSLFGIPMTVAVDIRPYRQAATNGLDYFSDKDMVFSALDMKQEKMRMMGNSDPRKRDPMYYENDERDFDYEAILNYAIENEVKSWPL